MKFLVFGNIDFFKNCSDRAYKMFLGISLLVLGICVLGLPYYRMGFINDDFGCIFYYRLKSWRDIIQIFSYGCIEGVCRNGDEVAKAVTSTALYRPLGMVFLGLEQYLWGLNAYGYYLVNVLLHSINSLLLLNIFSWFIGIRLAFLGSLLFLFHGAVGSWLFLICTIQDILNLTFFLLVILIYRKYLNLGGYKYYFLSAMLFLACLFTREPLVVFPFAMALFIGIVDFSRYKTWLTLFFNVFKKVYLFFVCLIIYFTARGLVFGFKISNYTGVYDFGRKSLKENIWNCLEFLKDISNFTFLSDPDPRWKALFLFPLVLFLFFLFIKNTQKIYLSFLVLSALLFSWPSLIMTHYPRYIYPGIPFFILFLLIAFGYSRINFREGWGNKFIYVFFLNLTVWGIIDGAIRTARNEEITYIGKLALKDFTERHLFNYDGKEKIVFLGIPHCLFRPYLPEAFWLYSGNENLKIYHEQSMDFVLGDYRKLESYKNINRGLSINVIENGYRLISHNEKLFWMAYPKSDSQEKEGNVSFSCSGKKILNFRFDKWRARDVSFIFNKDYFRMDGKIKFYSWSWKQQRFCLLKDCLGK